MYQSFLAIVEKYPDTVAITNENDQITYARLLEQAEALRWLLKKKEAAPGKYAVVLIALPGGPHFTAIQLACFAEGAVAVPVPNRSTSREIRNYLGLVRPDLVVAESPGAAAPFLRASDRSVTLLSLTDAPEEKKEEGRRVLIWDRVVKNPGAVGPVSCRERSFPPDTAMIQFTSGSTGRPKAVLLSRDNIRACLENNRSFSDAFTGKHIFCPMPQFHAFGGAVTLEYLLNGSPVHLTNRFLPGEDLGRMRHYACAGLFCAPNYLKLLFHLKVLNPDDLPALRSVCMGTSAVDQGLVQRLREQFPDLTIWLRYGLAETVGTLTRLRIPAGRALSHPGLVGSPVPGVTLAPGLPAPGDGEPAEVRVRSQVIGLGQIRENGHWQPLTDADGFFPTGDLGYLDADGQLHLRGRISTFIKRNGFRINPFEIEELLRCLPGVREAVAVGIPDPLSGEQVIACIEPPPGAEGPDLQTLMKYCRDNLSAHKIPQRFKVVKTLPRNPTGKPDRPAIRSFAAGQMPGGITS